MSYKLVTLLLLSRNLKPDVYQNDYTISFFYFFKQFFLLNTLIVLLLFSESWFLFISIKIRMQKYTNYVVFHYCSWCILSIGIWLPTGWSSSCNLTQVKYVLSEIFYAFFLSEKRKTFVVSQTLFKDSVTELGFPSEKYLSLKHLF